MLHIIASVTYGYLSLIMKLFMYISQVFVRHMSINLGGADVSMAEHGLY